MSALTFTLKQAPLQRLDLSPLSCHTLQGLTKAEIAGLQFQYGKVQLRADELFSIEGEDSQHLILRETTSKCDYIGKDLTGGQITVEGDAGAYLGFNMRSGTIVVKGNTGLYTGCELKNGQIEVQGNTGDFLGGALPGNKQGMKNGIILVKGNAGDRVGDHMRSGQILIEGNAGDYCGSRMMAGTIAVMGSTGQYLGFAMRRGTILLWNTPRFSPTFNDCGSHTLAFLPMLFASFRSLNSKFANAEMAFKRVQRYAGDMSEIGRGEVLVKR